MIEQVFRIKLTTRSQLMRFLNILLPLFRTAPEFSCFNCNFTKNIIERHQHMRQDIIELKVDGMTCSNCAASLNKFLERKGLEEVYVNFQTKEVRYAKGEASITEEEVKKGIHKLGFSVLEESSDRKIFWTLERKLLVSSIFTLPLLLYHFVMMAGVEIGFMENYWIQLVICLPTFAIGFIHFGRSGLSSLKGGVPNMDVLIFIGSTAAFIYSLVGTFMWEADYIFYETSATIITLVLVGNWLEKRAVEQTTTAIGELTSLQAEKARKIMPSGTIVTLDTKEIKIGDHLQVNEGDKIPLDGLILKGNVSVDESMLTGESIPVDKSAGDQIIGSSIVISGQMQMKVTATGKDTVLSQMIELVKTAQQDKPDIQRLADRISAIFVPAVLSISLLTFLLGYFVFDLSSQQALMNSIAVLVISCPCAMGLATPTAVMVGVGRLARNGILVKGGQTLEIFSQIRHIVFDKTGTLTTGDFKIGTIDYKIADTERVNGLIYELEKHSSHPIANALLAAMSTLPKSDNIVFDKVEEQKGKGVFAIDKEGHQYKIGSERVLNGLSDGLNEGYQIYVTRDSQLLAGIVLSDDVKTGAQETINYLKKHEIIPIILSGDKKEKTAEVAHAIGIKEYYAEQLPEQKLEVVERLSQVAPTAMVGDGINDAPALAKATLGISLSNASQAAIKSAQIVLLNGTLDRLQKAFAISKETVQTIRQNLFWAFAYNIIAIPIAAMGFLNPMWGALFMAFSDVIVIGNSIRLKYKRIK